MEGITTKKNKKKIKEIDIQNFVFNNFRSISNNVYIPYTKEKTLSMIPYNYRCDIFGYSFNENNKKKPFILEIKLDSNKRDLMLELNKAIHLKNTRKHKNGLDIMIVLESILPFEVDFCFENDIKIFLFTISNFSPLNITLREVTTKEEAYASNLQKFINQKEDDKNV